MPFDIENLTNPEDDDDGSQDLEALKAELDKRAEELAKKEKDLQKGFMEISERERRISDSVKPSVKEPDDDLEVPPEAAKILDSYISKKITPLEEQLRQTYMDAVSVEIERTAEKAGVTPDELMEIVDKYGLTPKDNSIASAREVLSRAADINAKNKSSADEAEIEARVRAKVLEELAKEGVSIEGVKPSRELPDTEPEEESMTQAQRYEWIKRRQRG